MSDQSASATAAVGAEPPPAAERTTRRGWPASLSFTRIGTVYIWIVAVIVFSAWKPGIFPQYLTVTGVLNAAAIPGLLALALVVPLAAGVFDLSVGFILGMANVVTASLLNHGQPLITTIVLTLLVCLAVGIVNGIVVVLMRVDSFIGTLATGSLLTAAILAVSGNQEITGDVGTIQNLVARNLHFITLPVFVFLAVAVVLWFVLDLTVTGRRIYATGLGKEQARLAGISTGRLQFGSFLVSAVLAGAAGIMLTGVVGSGSPAAGPAYLIPAFAAAFLGATQLKDGLFNAPGTVMAVLLLGTINEGLALATSALWAPYVFNGVVLIAALGLRVLQSHRAARRKAATRWIDDPGPGPHSSTQAEAET